MNTAPAIPPPGGVTRYLVHAQPDPECAPRPRQRADAHREPGAPAGRRITLRKAMLGCTMNWRAPPTDLATTSAPLATGLDLAPSCRDAQRNLTAGSGGCFRRRTIRFPSSPGAIEEATRLLADALAIAKGDAASGRIRKIPPPSSTRWSHRPRLASPHPATSQPPELVVRTPLSWPVQLSTRPRSCPTPGSW